jgi:hypothetical protein
MVNLRRLTSRAKDVIEKRGGTDALKEDAKELRDIAKRPGSLKDKAKAAADAVKDPGATGRERGRDAGSGPVARGDRAAGPSGAPQERPPEGPGPSRSK